MRGESFATTKKRFFDEDIGGDIRDSNLLILRPRFNSPLTAPAGFRIANILEFKAINAIFHRLEDIELRLADDPKTVRRNMKILVAKISDQ
jgi:hypothetical protein